MPGSELVLSYIVGVMENVNKAIEASIQDNLLLQSTGCLSCPLNRSSTSCISNELAVIKRIWVNGSVIELLLLQVEEILSLKSIWKSFIELLNFRVIESSMGSY